MRVVGQIWTMAAKDLILTARSRHSFLTTLFFGLLILVIFNFAFQPGVEATRLSLPGILWVALLFPGIIQLNNSFQREQEQGTLQAILLSPVDRGALFLSKCLSNWIFLICIDMFILLAFTVLFNPRVTPRFFMIVPIILVASAGFTAVGTLFAAMVVSLRAREVVFPVLLFSIIIPIILAAVSATQELLLREQLEYLGNWIQILVAFDVIFLSAGFLVFEYVVVE